jgi:hypothetical protein
MHVQQAIEFMGVWQCLCDAQWFTPVPDSQLMAILNLLTFTVAFFEKRVAPARPADYAATVIAESSEKMEGGGVHLDLWMKVGSNGHRKAVDMTSFFFFRMFTKDVKAP